jgi:hypothetical protein
MSTPDSTIVAHPTDRAKRDSLAAPQSFTIRCAECADTEDSHLPHCPGVVAAGYDTVGTGAFSSTVYPKAGGNFCSHESALGALRFYLMFGPVELHLADGSVFTFEDLPLSVCESD